MLSSQCAIWELSVSLRLPYTWPQLLDMIRNETKPTSTKAYVQPQWVKSDRSE